MQESNNVVEFKPRDKKPETSVADMYKFRAYHKSAKKMYECECVYAYTDDSTQGGEVFLIGEQNSFYFPEEVEIMQSTGLRDKNGVLIYESDIVRLTNQNTGLNEIRAVIHKDCAFHFSLLNNSMQIDRPLYCYAINYLNHYKNITLEVLGNLYENADLMGAQT